MRHRARRTAISTLAIAGVMIPVAAQAAPVLSRADAEAVNISVAGNGQGTGRAEATFDGSRENVSGPSTPAVPTGGFINAGVLTQQATAGNGFSAACAGLAGQGGGIVQLGDGSCLTPGNTLDGSLTDLSLGDLSGGIDELPPELRDALTPVLAPLTGGAEQIDNAIEQVLGPIEEQTGALGLQLRLDAVEGRCRVDDGSPSGSASIANASLVATGAGREVVLADFPADPAPNTVVVTGLSDVVELLLRGVEANLSTALDGELDTLGKAAIAPLREQLVSGIRDNLEEQLAPLEENLLRIVLNEQTRPTDDSIRVTALRAEVLPVAREQLDASLVDLRIGTVGCGPADRVTAPVEQVQEAAPAPAAPAKPTLPTAVSAGVAGEDARVGVLPLAALAAGAAAAGAAGLSAVRRRRELRD